MNNKDSYFKYMFSGVDTKMVCMSSATFILLGFFIEGGWIMCLTGAITACAWFGIGFSSWKKYGG